RQGPNASDAGGGEPRPSFWEPRGLTMRTTHRILVNDEYIAAAQHLSIAQNRGLRLIYQTWWMVWPPRAILFACVVGSFFFWILRPTAAFCGALLALSFASEVFSLRSLAIATQRI